jgi:hypothetical protein
MDFSGDHSEDQFADLALEHPVVTHQSVKRIIPDPSPKDEVLTLVHNGIIVFKQGNDNHIVTGGFGVPKEQGFATKAKMVFDVHKLWTSDLRIEIQMNTHQLNLVTGKPESDTFHNIVIKVTSAQVDIQNETWQYSEFPYDLDNPYEEAFMEYAYPTHESNPKINAIRGNGNFMAFVFKFLPIHAHDEGVRVDKLHLDGGYHIHDFFKTMFTGMANEVVEVWAFLQVHQKEMDVFNIDLKAYLDQVKKERHFPPLIRWYQPQKEYSPKIQRGQITKLDDRPLVKLPYQRSYRSLNHWLTMEGIALVQNDELTRKILANTKAIEVDLRILQTNAGTNKEYICLMRIPDGFPVRLTEDDSFKVAFPVDGKPDTFDWSAHTMSQVFVFANSTDLTLTLSRPYDKELGWSEYEPQTVLDISKLERSDANNEMISRFCMFSPPNKVKVQLVHSDKPLKAVLAALKMMNPNDTKKEPEVTVTKWHSLLLAQDLGIHNQVDLLPGLDIGNTLSDFKFDSLNTEQRAWLHSLQALPNELGLLKGPPGTGKTVCDVAAAMLALANNGKVLVVSPTNDTADSYVIKLLAMLKDVGLDKKVARVHSAGTEQGVIKVENAKYVQHKEEPDSDRLRWQRMDPAQDMFYDNLIHTLVDQSKLRPHGVRDRRYKIHEASLATMILKETGLLSRTAPYKPEERKYNNAAERKAAKKQRTAEKLRLCALQQSQTGQGSVAEQFRAANRVQNAENLANVPTETADEVNLRLFKQNFLRKQSGVELDPEATKVFNQAYNELRNKAIRLCDVIVTTCVNAYQTAIRDNFHPTYVIVQEATQVGMELYITMAFYPVPHLLSGDDKQLPPYPVETVDNPFGVQLNRSFFERLVTLGAPCTLLNTQYRMIPIINEMVSRIFYKGLLKADVNEFERPNSKLAVRVLREKFGIRVPMAFLDIPGEAEKVGATQSKRNIDEAAAVVDLIIDFIAKGISSQDIMILAGYKAQVKLLTKQLQVLNSMPQYSEIDQVKIHTIDSYQGHESSVVIFSLVSTGVLGFLRSPARLLVAVSRARDALVVLGNHSTLEPRHNTYIYNLIVEYFKSVKAYVHYNLKPAELGLMEQENTLIAKDLGRSRRGAV